MIQPPSHLIHINIILTYTSNGMTKIFLPVTFLDQNQTYHLPHYSHLKNLWERPFLLAPLFAVFAQQQHTTPVVCLYYPVCFDVVEISVIVIP